MSTQEDCAEDPVIKGAVRAIYGRHRAPDEFRARMVGMLRSAPQPPQWNVGTMLLGMWQRLARLAGGWRGPTAMAAALMFGFAGIRAGFGQPARVSIGQSLVRALVETHDRCCLRQSHITPGIPQTSLKLVGQAISRRLRQSVLAADLAKDNWLFRGAAVCEVAGRRSAHLLFTREGQTLSVFSIPDPLSPVRDCALEGGVWADHAVAGFVKRGRVYCMVGHCPRGSLGPGEVASLLERHRGDLVDDATTIALLAPEDEPESRIAAGR